VGWKWNEGVLDDSRLAWINEFADGNDQDEADASWHKEGVALASGATETLDLAALVRTVLGDSLTTTFLTIKALLIVNTATAGLGELLVGGAAANEWFYPFGAAGDKVSVPLNSPMLLSNTQWGWAVNDTHKNLKLEASGGDVTFSIAILGTITSSGTGSSGA
jgi:hypothetical protein